MQHEYTPLGASLLIEQLARDTAPCWSRGSERRARYGTEPILECRADDSVAVGLQLVWLGCCNTPQQQPPHYWDEALPPPPPGYGAFPRTRVTDGTRAARWHSHLPPPPIWRGFFLQGRNCSNCKLGDNADFRAMLNTELASLSHFVNAKALFRLSEA